MEYDPLKQLTEFFESKGYVGKKAAEEAELAVEKAEVADTSAS